MTNKTNKPITKLYDGNLSLPIYKNMSKNGHFYSIGPVQRSYDAENGERQYTSSISGDQILRAQRLIGKSYDVIEEYKAIDRQSDKAAA
ncbi:MAG: hypothetical protein AAF720_06100 [Pseudomonadota bacterium]